MTHPQPQDAEIVDRMRAAHHHARQVLGVQAAASTEHEAWGWRGRTLGAPVTTPDGAAWLRVAGAQAAQIVRTFWDGNLHAETAIPPTIPRSHLRRTHDWNDGPWRYRAELYDHANTRAAASSRIVQALPTAPPLAWWNALRTALDDITTVPTQRHTIHQTYLDWVMPHYLGEPIDTQAPSWTTAHGDLHWANLGTPELHIYDWEGWGLAPTSYDAAMLHTTSLLVPPLAALIRHELAHHLHTLTGQYAELATIAELLHVTHDDHPEATQPLRNRATLLLQRPVPRTTPPPPWSPNAST